MTTSDLHEQMAPDVSLGLFTCIRDELGTIIGYGISAVGEAFLAIDQGGNVAASGVA